MLKVVVVFIFIASSLVANMKDIEKISKQMQEIKVEFDKSLKSLNKQTKELEELKNRYNIKERKEEKNIIAIKINQKQKAVSSQHKKTLELKNNYNAKAYLLAKQKHDTLSRLLSKEEIVVAKKGQSCKNLTLKECQKKAYDNTKKEVEKFSHEAIVLRAKNSGIELSEKKILDGIQTNIQSYSNVDYGYFYVIKSEVNAELIMDEYDMFDIEKITWNELFKEPEEIPKIPLDNLEAEKPIEKIAPQEVAPSVYHSGLFVSLMYGMANHSLSSSKKYSANSFAFRLGNKTKLKDRVYYEHEIISDSNSNTLTLKSVHMDWSINLKRAIYPYYGIGYSIANLKASKYKYEGSAYHIKVGVGYEVKEDMEINLAYRMNRIIWAVANDNTSIASLGMYRDTSSYNIIVSYLF